MKHLLASALIGFCLCVPAHAAAEPLDAAIGAITQGLIEERDVDLVFGYLHEAFDGALQGREVAPPAALTQRAEAIGDEAKRRGAVAGHALLDAIERAIRESMKAPATGRSRSSI
jgi:hypothetical protein